MSMIYRREKFSNWSDVLTVVLLDQFLKNKNSAAERERERERECVCVFAG